MSEANIKARIAGREKATEMVKLATELVSICEWEDGTGADYAESLLKEMAKLLPKRKQPEPEKPIPFARLKATVIPTVYYQGNTLGNVPTDYVDRLCREHEDLLKVLKEYLRQLGEREKKLI